MSRPRETDRQRKRFVGPRERDGGDSLGREKDRQAQTQRDSEAVR